MRHLLHFGIFVLALAAVTQADAQDRRRGDRHTTVVIAADRGQVARPVRPSVPPTRVRYDSRRPVRPPTRPVYDGRLAYLDQRQDLAQIVSIARRWERATAYHDRHLQATVDRQLDGWFAREIRESSRERYNYGYTQRVRLLRDELAVLEHRKHNRHAQHGRGRHGRDQRGYYENKSRILDELVRMSERQVQRAQVNVRYPLRLSFARR